MREACGSGMLLKWIPWPGWWINVVVVVDGGVYATSGCSRTCETASAADTASSGCGHIPGYTGRVERTRPEGFGTCVCHWIALVGQAARVWQALPRNWLRV